MIHLTTRYKNILFDLDGTLTDSGPGIINSVEYALTKLSYELEDKTVLRKFIGPPLLDSFKNYCGFSEDKAGEALKYYREYFQIKGIYENAVYDGIEELLKSLKEAGARLIVATGKPEMFTDIVLKHFDLLKYFDFVAGSLENESRVYKDEVIKYAIEENNLTSDSSIIMIGDRNHDINGAKKNCIPVVGILYGYGNREELEEAKADFIFESVSDLKDFLLIK